MWPGAAAPDRTTWRTRSASTGQGADEQRRVEVALHRVRRPDPPAGLGQRQPPVHADHLGAGLAHQPEQLGGAHAEVDPRDAGVGQGAEHLRRVGLGVAGVVRRAQAARPGVEQLDRRGAGGDLGPAGRSRTARPAGSRARPTAPAR